jgi:hypothetical protein
MIKNEIELQATRKRINDFLDLLSQLRHTTRPEERSAVMSGYRSEVERMQREILDYLTSQDPARTAMAG